MNSNTSKYPPSLVETIRSRFRKEQTTTNVLALIDYMFGKVYQTNDRWVEIPTQTIRDILKGNSQAILTKLKDLISHDPKYSPYKHNCQSYCFTDKFVSYFPAVDAWKDFIIFLSQFQGYGYTHTSQTNVPTTNEIMVGGNVATTSDMKVVSGEGKSTNKSTNNKPSSFPPTLLPHSFGCQDTTYRLDYERVEKVWAEIFDPSKYKEERILISARQTAKTNLENILKNKVKETISDKTKRHYTSLTQLQREIRACLIKEGGEYWGELDLKCCHSLIVLNKMKSQLTAEEYKKLWDMLIDPDLWNKMMKRTGISDKARVKDKHNLFLNGSLRQNYGNPVYLCFKEDHSHFTELLFGVKEDRSYNLSNEVSQEEASVMWSEEVKSFVEASGIKYDTIHDCLWIYGSPTEEAVLGVAQFILRQFKDKRGIDMVFTLEVVGKPKQIIKNTYDAEVQAFIDAPVPITDYMPSEVVEKPQPDAYSEIVSGFTEWERETQKPISEHRDEKSKLEVSLWIDMCGGSGMSRM